MLRGLSISRLPQLALEDKEAARRSLLLVSQDADGRRTGASNALEATPR